MPVIFWPLGKGSGGTTPGTCPALDVPVLAVTDNADGTGGVATVTGSTAGTTNTLWAWPYPTAGGSLTRTTVGSRVGDGTIAVGVPADLALGAWLWMVESRQDESVEVSNLVARALTDPADAVSALYYRILNAAAAVVRALGLPESPRVEVARVPAANEGDLPAVFVSPTEEAPGAEHSENDLQLDFPALVTFVRADANRARFALMEVMMYWREHARKALHKPGLAGVPEVFDARVDLYPNFPLPAWLANRDASSILVTFSANTDRADA